MEQKMLRRIRDLAEAGHDSAAVAPRRREERVDVDVT
jgi:hypothetical protein